MDITPHIRESRVIIDGYGDGGFRVNGDRRDGALIVLEDHAVSISATDLASLPLEMLQPLFGRGDLWHGRAHGLYSREHQSEVAGAQYRV